MSERAKSITYDRLYYVYKLLIEAAAGDTGQSEHPATAETEPDKPARQSDYASLGRAGQAAGGEL